MFLYKYRSLDEKSKQFTHNIIKKQELFFPSPSEFNDPFEFRPYISLEASEPEIEEYFDYLCRRMSPKLNEIQRKERVADLIKNSKDNPLAAAAANIAAMVQQKMETYGVLCLTECSSNLLMWAHYADNHRGVCLGFDASITNPFFNRALKVTYSPTYPTVNLFRDTRDSYDEFILTKSKHWDYEDEWRIIEHKQGRGVQQFSSSDLKEVIFGLKTEQPEIEEIIYLLSQTQQRPKLFRAKRHDKKYKLVLTQIDI